MTQYAKTQSTPAFSVLLWIENTKFWISNQKLSKASYTFIRRRKK